MIHECCGWQHVVRPDVLAWMGTTECSWSICLQGLWPNNVPYCNTWCNRQIRMSCLSFPCKTSMCVWVGGCSGKRPRGYKTRKITNGKEASSTSRLSGLRITVGWNEEKKAAFQRLSSATHIDIPRQLHVLMRSWLSIHQSDLMRRDDNLENGFISDICDNYKKICKRLVSNVSYQTVMLSLAWHRNVVLMSPHVQLT